VARRAHRAGEPAARLLTADQVAGYLTHLEALGRAEATIRKDHAALNRLARYLHAIRAVDATEILIIAGTPINDQPAPATPSTRPRGARSRRSPAPA
jgi:hypothetical protein